LLKLIKIQWKSASDFKRFVLVAGFIVIIAIVACGFYLTLKDDYQVLFSDLNAQDASAIMNELERLKVPYKIADDGTTILVTGDAVYKTRLKIMGKGLNLQGSVGFEIFNNAEFGMTEFAQKINYQRALQGELARTIMGFDEIKSARVHLVLPEAGLFKNQNSKPKASVSIVMKSGAVLSPEQISGIQRLVAASTSELIPAEVTIMDQKGLAVSKQISDDSTEAKLQDQLEIKKQLEDYLVRKIVNVADKVVGPGKAIVSVDVTLNYDQIKVVKDDVIPLPQTSGQEVGAVSHRRETYQGGNEGNEPSAGPDTANNLSSTEVDYSNSRRVEQVLSSQGSILRLNVGVLLPDVADKVKLEKMKDVISMAVGINASRGDGLAVYSVDMPVMEQGNKSDIAMDTPPPIKADLHKKKVTQGNDWTSEIADSKSILLTLFAGIFCILLIYLWSPRSAAPAKLDPAQREKMLDEISQWLKSQSS
jgi:flagellar M-ring protein FliF